VSREVSTEKCMIPSHWSLILKGWLCIYFNFYLMLSMKLIGQNSLDGLPPKGQPTILSSFMGITGKNLRANPHFNLLSDPYVKISMYMINSIQIFQNFQKLYS